VRILRHVIALVAFVCLAWIPTSCGGGRSDIPDFPTVIPLGEGDVFPSILNSSLAVGENRVAWQLIDGDDNLLLDGGMRIRYFNLNAEKPRLVAEVEARLISSETNFIDENNGFERTVTGTTGVYVTYVTFDEPGDYGAEVKVFRPGANRTVLYRFTVREKSEEPLVGDPAPPSVQATTATEPIEEIDSSFPFRAEMHTTSVADALQSGKPIVVTFATPAFCTSRTCGPMLDLVVDPLFFRYQDQVVFIHIEPYVLGELREAGRQQPVPAVLEWGLQTEPWIFVIGRDGRIAAKFEGIAARDEVESIVQLLLEEGATATPAPAPTATAEAP
jgi:hypothetical protein